MITAYMFDGEPEVEPTEAPATEETPSEETATKEEEASSPV